MRPTMQEDLDCAAVLDLLADARSAEEQARTGPFWPERGLTAESLLAYAAKCRAQAERYRDGGAHNAVMRGEEASTVDIELRRKLDRMGR